MEPPLIPPGPLSYPPKGEELHPDGIIPPGGIRGGLWGVKLRWEMEGLNSKW